MNERILELMNQANKTAGFTFSMDQAKPVHDLMDKFAELIVKECAKISEDCGINLNREDFRQGISRNIKQHFGVK